MSRALTPLTPKAAIEKVDGVCTPSGIGYDVLAPTGYCFGYPGEHTVLADTLIEAKRLAKAIVRCECGCAEWQEPTA